MLQFTFLTLKNLEKFTIVSYHSFLETKDSEENYLVLCGGFYFSIVPDKEKFLISKMQRIKEHFKKTISEYNSFPSSLEIEITGLRDNLEKEVKVIKIRKD